MFMHMSPDQVVPVLGWLVSQCQSRPTSLNVWLKINHPKCICYRQIGAGVLTFSYWKSKNSPSLRVCGRKPPGYPNSLDCNWYSTNEFHGQQWVKDRVIIPPSDSAFEVQLEQISNKNLNQTSSTFFLQIIFVAQITDRNNLISIDDIQYRASLGQKNLVDSKLKLFEICCLQVIFKKVQALCSRLGWLSKLVLPN